jgi:hypothetical protein
MPPQRNPSRAEGAAKRILIALRGHGIAPPSPNLEPAGGPVLRFGAGDAEMTMVEDARIARDAINRLTTLLVKSDATPEEILDVANDVQIKDQSRLSSRAEIDEARTDAWLAICDLAEAVKTGTADIEWQNAIALIWAWRRRAG